MADPAMEKRGAMALLVLFLVVSAAADGDAAASSTCSMSKEELEDCRGKIFKAFEDQSQSSLTLEDPQAVQRCCDHILAAEPEPGCVRRVCPASLPGQVCPALLGDVCPGHNGSVNETASKAASPLQRAPGAFLIELLCFAMVAYIK